MWFHPPGAFSGSMTTFPATSEVGVFTISAALFGRLSGLFRFSVMEVEKLTMLFGFPATMEPSPPNGPLVPYPDG